METRHTGCATLAAVLLAAAVSTNGEASDAVRRSYDPLIGRPAIKAQFLGSPASHWQGPLRWRYNHAGATQRWVNAKYPLIRIVAEAIRMWTLECGIEAIYEGETDGQPSWEGPDGANVVGWLDLGLFEAAAEAWVWAREGGDEAIHDADIVLNNAFAFGLPVEPAQMRGLLAHEWGHAIGLAHSDVAGVVMSGQPYTPYNDVSVLQPDDVDGCRAMYGPPRTPAPILPEVVEAVEFHRADRDHYFMTHDAEEIAALDDGRTAGWVRTGLTVKAFPAPFGDTASVCRVYLPPAIGDGHFYGRDARECAAVEANLPGVVVESASFLHAFLPVNGVCRDQTSPVYRVWSNRPGVNHRYTMVRAERDFMLQKGWMAEGDGPDAITMCAPD